MVKPDELDVDRILAILPEEHPARKGDRLKNKALRVLTRSALPSRVTALPPDVDLRAVVEADKNPVRNTELFDRIADAIDYFPEAYYQGDWGRTASASPMCGTAFCIAGHGAHETGWKPDAGMYSSLRQQTEGLSYHLTTSTLATYELGLTVYECDVLFNATWTPREDLTVGEALRKIGRGALVTDVTDPLTSSHIQLSALREEYNRRGEIRTTGGTNDEA